MKGLINQITLLGSHLIEAAQQVRERDKFYMKYYSSWIKRAFLDVLIKSRNQSLEVKQLRLYAFESRKQSLQQKAFLILKSFLVTQSNIRKKSQYLSTISKQKNQQKYLHIWIRNCVLNYQVKCSYERKLYERSFLGWKLWHMYVKQSRSNTEQALQYDQYRLTRRIFDFWREYCAEKLREKEMIYEHESNYLVAWMKQFKFNEIMNRKILFAWHSNASSQQRNKVLKYRASKFQKRSLGKRYFNNWVELIEEKQKNYLLKYKANKKFKEMLLRKCFEGWWHFIGKQRETFRKLHILLSSSSVSHAQIFIQNLKQIKLDYNDSENSALKYYQKQLMKRVFFNLSFQCQTQHYLKKLLTNQKTKKCQILKFGIFIQWKEQAEDQQIYRREVRLGNLFRKKHLFQSALKAFKLFQEFNKKSKLLIQQIRIRRSQYWMTEIQKVFQLSQFIKNKQTKLINATFKVMRQYMAKKQYKFYSTRYQQLKKAKKIVESSFNRWIIYYQYRLKKRSLQQNMRQFHCAKWIKKLLQKWQEVITRKQEEQQIAQYISLGKEYKLKKTTLRKMMVGY